MCASLAATALFLSSAYDSADASAPNWRITKTEWTADDEKGFGEFVRIIAESGCKTTVECIKHPANPYRHTDPEDLAFHADCAKWVYMLRAYYASKNGLPFSYVDYISGIGADLRFTATSNSPISRKDLVDYGVGIPLVSTLKTLHAKVWSATFRMHPAEDQAIMPDFYSPKLQPGSIRAGTVLYDINGHVAIVYGVTPDGRILYMDAHPDESVTRSVYGPQFGQSPAKLGGGFKNFRPMKLVDAIAQPDGTYLGGRVVLAANSEIPDYSLEQYEGNVAETRADGPNAVFEYNRAQLGLFGYIRASMSGGSFAFNPMYELQTSMKALCHEVKERHLQVNLSIAAGVHAKPHPGRLPGTAAGTDNEEWLAHSSDAIDARLRNSAAQLYRDMAEMVSLWQQRDPRIVYDGASLKEGLQRIYAAETQACTITYTNSDQRAVQLDLDTILTRLFALSANPYSCIERRWGAAGEELASCKDNATKTRWHHAQQRLRNLAAASYSARPPLTLAQLESGAPGIGADTPPQVHLKRLIDAMEYPVSTAARTNGLNVTAFSQ